jgi:hypothetical protein
MNTASEKVVVIEPRFKLTPFSELKLGTERAYLVKGLIPRTGLIVVWGPPKSAKTFWMFDVAMHLALGWGYRGRRVQQGPVVYCAFEGAEGFKARAEAFRLRRLAEDHAAIDFHLLAARSNLVADHGELIAAVRAQLEARPILVVLDTLNRSLAGSESDDKDMAAYVKAADAIREAFGCAVVIVHHCGVDGTRPRGHTSLTGAADAQLAVKRDAAGNILVIVEWMKDGPEGDVTASRLEVVEVGTDPDGEPITSCVVVAVDAPPARDSSRAARLPKAAQTALRALSEVLGEQGEAPPPSNHIPNGAKVVSVAAWREQAYRRGISTSDEPDSKRRTFQRASQYLISLGRVGIWDNSAWLP